MMRTIVGQKFKIVLIVELCIALLYFIDFKIFLNAQIAALSSFLIILATTYTHQKMVHSRVSSGIYSDDDRDPLEKIDDPHGLFEEDTINDAPFEELNVKEIIQEEKKRSKTITLSNMKQGLKGSFSLLRLGGYLFLIFGFIGLKNNENLMLLAYMPSLLIGIVLGYFVMKKV